MRFGLRAVSATLLCVVIISNGISSPSDLSKASDAAVDEALFSGRYGLTPDSAIVVGVSSTFGGMIATELPSGELRRLVSLTPTEFSMGPSIGRELPATAKVRFDVEGAEVRGLWMIRDGEAARYAKRLSRWKREEVRFVNGAVMLSGTLLVPPGLGPHPVMVYAHGAGLQTRAAAPAAEIFADLGFAVLTYDKRGTGRSTGDWRSASLADLESDLGAAIAFARSRKEIDSKRVGLWCFSQGGWLATMAAARLGDIAFMIVTAGSGVSVAENVAYEAEGQMREAGLSDDEVREGSRVARELFRLASSSASPARAKALVDESRGKRWASHVFLLNEPLGGEGWQWVQREGPIDSSSVLPKVRCPVLWIFAGRDIYVDPIEGRERIEKAAARGGNRNVTIAHFAEANHYLLECRTGFESEVAALTRFAPGYWATVTQWLRERKEEGSR